MQEVTFRLRFTLPCLGARGEEQEYTRRVDDGRGTVKARRFVFAMPKHNGQVTFAPAWWRSVVRYGATLRGGDVALVDKIEWGLVVDGTPRLWQRRLAPDPARPGRGRDAYAQHEAFVPDDVVSVDCVLPTGLNIERFGVYLAAAGKYRGISPYKPGAYGRFAVVEVVPKGAVLQQRREHAVMTDA